MNATLDRPVGEDLQEHPFVSLSYLTDRETLFAAAREGNFRLFSEERRGPPTSNVGEGVADRRSGLRPGLKLWSF